MDLSLVEDPYPYFENLRRRGTVVPLPAHNVVAVVGYDEALAVHNNNTTLSAVNSVTGPLPPIPFAPHSDDIGDLIEQHRPQMPFGEEVLTLDPPRHGPLRSLMMRLFTPRRLEEMEASITELADQLIDEFAASGHCEFVRQFASPFALLAIADLLGVPEEDRDAFRKNMEGAPAQIGAGSEASVVNPMEFRVETFLRYVDERRRDPRGDIMGQLANATFPDGTTPTAMDVVRVATLLFGAGQDTTATLLGASLRIIAEQPELQARLRADRSLIPEFIEEVLRHSGPVKSTFRLARKLTEIGGVNVAPGTTVMITTAAVNRDPRKFDGPAEFRLGRPSPKDHLAFGRGPHTCPGAALARLETRVSLERILDRLGTIELNPEHHGPEGDRRFSYMPTYVFRALQQLHLRFKPL
ncbi:cytochrome P450 [Novosphingobium sp. G106]|nr:cytochrome P450 [Novosphingobium sp. G106]